jgi:ABC-type dipeptide/oligopeptide/nickel transport system permease subunit
MKYLVWRRAARSGRFRFGLLVILFLVLIAALTPWISPHDPFESSFTQSRLPPAWVQGGPEPGMAEFPLGTDRAGRDILSRLIHGTRTAVALALAAVPLAALIGALMGVLAGYLGKAADAWLTFFFDTVQSLPGIMFMVLIVLIFRTALAPTWINGVLTLVVGFAAVSWVSLARLVRVSTQQIKAQPFVEAAISLGGSPGHILGRHLLPNVSHVIVVWIINNIPAVILLEALLGYVGIGVTRAVDGDEFGIVSWGGLIFTGRSALSFNPLMVIGPSLGILLMTMSFILLGDALSESRRRGRE